MPSSATSPQVKGRHFKHFVDCLQPLCLSTRKKKRTNRMRGWWMGLCVLPSLPIRAGVQFSRDSIYAFNDHMKIRVYRGL